MEKRFSAAEPRPPSPVHLTQQVMEFPLRLPLTREARVEPEVERIRILLDTARARSRAKGWYYWYGECWWEGLGLNSSTWWEPTRHISIGSPPRN